MRIRGLIAAAVPSVLAGAMIIVGTDMILATPANKVASDLIKAVNQAGVTELLTGAGLILLGFVYMIGFVAYVLVREIEEARSR